MPLKLSRRTEYLLTFKKSILWLCLLGLCSSSFYLVGPYLSVSFVDTSFLRKDAHSFFRLTLFGIALFVFSLIFKAAAEVIKNRIRVKTKLKLTDEFLRKALLQDLAFFQTLSSGENIYRFADLERVSNFFIERIPNFLADILRLLIMLGICIFLNARLTLGVLSIMPLFAFQSLYLRKKIRLIYEEAWRLNARMFKKMQEMFSKALILKAFGLEGYQRRAYARLLIKSLRLSLQGMRVSLLNSLSSEFFLKLVFGVVSLYGGWLIIKGDISLGNFTATMIYIAQLGLLIKSLTLNFEYLNQESISVNKFLEITEKNPAIKDVEGALALHSIGRGIEFRNLRFGYGPERSVLQGVSLNIPVRRWIGLVGPSGCGKTTLVNLLLRLYEPQEGKMLLDEIDLSRISLRSLRERITIATQEPLLFDLSFKENIALGVRHITQIQVEGAARVVRLHDFILSLPQGYDTLIGENGCKLSQGYKQRVCLARAIVRNPDLLILDEATSSIDSATEEIILKALRETRKGRSTMVISHRLSTIKSADLLFFFRPDGAIEEGTHDELLTKSREYQDFFQNQIAEENQRDLAREF